MAAEKKAGIVATKNNEMRDWQVEEDLRVMISAQKIRKDPQRMKAVQKMAKDRLADIAAIAGGAGKTAGN